MTRARVARSATAEHKSQGVAQVADPRVERTRARITAAFAHFLMRRPYARIRVSDITRKARVGRATFYAHFASKDALLGAEMRRISVPMIRPPRGRTGLADCTAFFAHLQHARPIYRSLMSGESRVVAERILQDAIEERIAQFLPQPGSAREGSPAMPAFVSRFASSTLLALVAWSLEQEEPPGPVALQEVFRSLVGPALGVGPPSPRAPGGLASQGSPAPAARSDASRNPASAPKGEGGGD